MPKGIPFMKPLKDKKVSAKRGRKKKITYTKGDTVSNEIFGLGTFLREGSGGLLICDFGGSVREVQKEDLSLNAEEVSTTEDTFDTEETFGEEDDSDTEETFGGEDAFDTEETFGGGDYGGFDE